jgi:hypothetical protein
MGWRLSSYELMIFSPITLASFRQKGRPWRFSKKAPNLITKGGHHFPRLDCNVGVGFRRISLVVKKVQFQYSEVMACSRVITSILGLSWEKVYKVFRPSLQWLLLSQQLDPKSLIYLHISLSQSLSQLLLSKRFHTLADEIIPLDAAEIEARFWIIMDKVRSAGLRIIGVGYNPKTVAFS